MEALHGPQWREVEEAEKAEAKEVKLAVQRAKRAVVRAAKEVVKVRHSRSQDVLTLGELSLGGN
jgi:hypothetical protein